MEKLKSNFIKHKTLFFGACIALQAVLFLSLLYAVFSLYLEYNVAKTQRGNELKALASLEKLLAKHNNYPQLYYEAALHAARLNDKQKSLEYLEKALQLNPDFKAVRDLQKQEMK